MADQDLENELEVILPESELPDFEGLSPVGVQTGINGSGNRIHRPIKHGEKLILVVEAELSNVAHKRTAKGIMRVHTLTVADLYELEGKQGRRLISSLRTAYQEADDARHGRTALPMTIEPEGVEGVEVTTDENGTALTPAEVAEKRGDHLESAGINTGPEPVAVVFDDESRHIWPDAFPKSAKKRPVPGDEMRVPGSKRGSDAVLIRKLLDIDSGEVIQEWTDADEDRYQRELEEAERKSEAEIEADFPADDTDSNRPPAPELP